MSASPAVPQRDLDRLIALGRQKGELSPADLQAALPIQTMSAEAIAQVVLDLDAAGIPVDLEDLLPGRAHPGGIAPIPLAPAPGPASLDVPASARRAIARPPQADAPVAPVAAPARAATPVDGRRVRNAVLAAGLIVLVLMGAALIVLGR